MMMVDSTLFRSIVFSPYSRPARSSLPQVILTLNSSSSDANILATSTTTMKNMRYSTAYGTSASSSSSIATAYNAAATSRIVSIIHQYSTYWGMPASSVPMANARLPSTFTDGQMTASKNIVFSEIQTPAPPFGANSHALRLPSAWRMPRVQRYRCLSRSSNPSGASV